MSVGSLNMEGMPSLFISKLIKQYEAYIIVFDWSSKESLLELEDWIELARELRDDPPIFLVGCNLDDIPYGLEKEFRDIVDRLKNKYLIFNQINAKCTPNMLLEREIKMMVTVLVQDCKTALTVARRKSTFSPINDPNWGFVLVD